MQQISALESAAEPTANLVLDEGVKLYCYPYRELLWLIQEGSWRRISVPLGAMFGIFPWSATATTAIWCRWNTACACPGNLDTVSTAARRVRRRAYFRLPLRRGEGAEESYTYRYASVAEDADGTLGFLFDPAGLETLLQENGLEQAEYLIPVQVSNSPGGEFTLLYIAPGRGSADDYVVLYGADLTGWENAGCTPQRISARRP